MDVYSWSKTTMKQAKNDCRMLDFLHSVQRRRRPQTGRQLHFTLTVQEVYHNDRAFYYAGPWKVMTGGDVVGSGQIHVYDKRGILPEFQRQVGFYTSEYFN